MNTEEIAFSVRKTPRLVREYEKIIDEYKDRSYFLKDLMNLEIGIETQTESKLSAKTRLLMG